MLLEGIPKSFFDFLLSEAVDERVQHGGHNRVENCGKLVHVHPVTLPGVDVDEDGASVVKCHHGDVRDAGGGLPPPLDRGDPDNGGDDAAVGPPVTSKEPNSSTAEETKLASSARDVGTGQLQHRAAVTEEVMDRAGPTKGQRSS